jgi:hypothetical protein
MIKLNSDEINVVLNRIKELMKEREKLKFIVDSAKLYKLMGEINGLLWVLERSVTKTEI